MGPLTRRIAERRQTDLTPLHERRGGDEPDYIVRPADRQIVPDHLRVPEWRRRGIEQVKERGYVAVTDLTRKVAA